MEFRNIGINTSESKDSPQEIDIKISPNHSFQKGNFLENVQTSLNSDYGNEIAINKKNRLKEYQNNISSLNFNFKRVI